MIPAVQEPMEKPSLEALGLDLLHVSVLERVVSLAVPFVMVAGFFLAGARGWWPVMLICAMAHCFFTYGSVSHDLVHRTLRLPPALNEILLALVEISGFRSGHAYRITHLHHHQRFPDPEDVEASACRLGWMGALMDGVWKQPRLWAWALLRSSGRQRRWILAEGLAVGLLAAGSLAAIPWTWLPAAYLTLMWLGSWIFPWVTVSIPHNPHSPTALGQTRLFRGRVLSWLALDHLYHLEHHLYPQVPHHRWAELARRLDPYFKAHGITPVVLGI